MAKTTCVNVHGGNYIETRSVSDYFEMARGYGALRVETDDDNTVAKVNAEWLGAVNC